MRAKNEDSLPSSYSHKNCTRPNPSPGCKQFFTSQNVVGLSARDKCLIGTAKSYFLIRWRMGWKLVPGRWNPGCSNSRAVHGRSRLLAPLNRRRLMRQAHGSPALALSASLLFPLRIICSRTWTLTSFALAKLFHCNPWEFARHTGTPQEHVILDVV
jgi:hypothetical protein